MFWGHIWQCTVEKIQTNTVEKSYTNATNVTLFPLIQVLWGVMWKCTVEKSRTNATNVTMPPLRQAIWGDIWKHTVKAIATNVNMPPLGQEILGNIWKCTVGKNQTNVINLTMPLLRQAIWGHIENIQWRKIKQKQPVWSKFFEETHKDAQIWVERRKITICNWEQFLTWKYNKP